MENEIEIWKDVIGYEGFYKVSNINGIKSLKRMEWSGNRYRKRGERILKYCIRNGYPSVILSKNSIKKHFTIHSLVAMHHVPNPLNLPEVNHKFGNKLDYRASQLEWTTRSDNMKHAFAIGLKQPMRGSKQGRSKLKEHQIFEIRKLISEGMNKRLICNQYKVSISAIWKIHYGGSWAHI